VPLTKEMQYLIVTKHWLDAMTPPLEERIKELCMSVKVLLEEPGKNDPEEDQV